MNSAIGYSEGAEVPEDKTDNELIARFMGLEAVQAWGTLWWKIPHTKGVQSKALKYQTSWDWLMPVVENINQTKPKHDFFAHLDLKNLTIDSLYKAAIEFIKWYNLESLKNKPI